MSAAFSESDPKKLIEIGLEQIPTDSEYTRVIRAMVDYHREHPENWHDGYAYLKANFGYDRYPGVVHIIPNAGVIALGLLYGEGDFSRSIRITNMGGWDTDCNVGNVGAIIGVAVGVDKIDNRWREPINDVLVAANVIGTRNISTIPQCVDLFCQLGRRMNGKLLEFGVWKNHSNAVVGFLVTDVTTADPKLIRRYMGEELFAAFRRYHGLPESTTAEPAPEDRAEAA